MAELALAYLERHAKPQYDRAGRLLRGKKSYATDRSRLYRYVLGDPDPERPTNRDPAGARWAHLKAAAITREDVAGLHTRIGSTRPHEANRVLNLIRVMFNKAAKWGLLPAGFVNPAEGVEKFKEPPRTRYLSSEEMERLKDALTAETGRSPRDSVSERIVAALEGAQEMTISEISEAIEHPKEKVTQLLAHLRGREPRLQRVRPGLYRHTGAHVDNSTPEAIYIRAALWMALLTGSRKTETLRLRWSDVDMERREIRLRDANTKTGKAQVKPLTPGAVAVLKNIPRKPGNPYVFCGRKEGQPLKELKSAWRRILRRAQITDLRMHDLRRTTATWMLQAGTPVPPEYWIQTI
jgi:integrase